MTTDHSDPAYVRGVTCVAALCPEPGRARGHVFPICDSHALRIQQTGQPVQAKTEAEWNGYQSQETQR